MKIEEAKLGTVVYIAGGPPMTIAEVSYNRIRAIWFNKEGSLEHLWAHHSVFTTEEPKGPSAYHIIPVIKGD